jgi:hypothetical protein
VFSKLGHQLPETASYVSTRTRARTSDLKEAGSSSRGATRLR